MQKWEYAQINWEGAGMGKHRSVEFTHHESWTKVGGNELFPLLRRLGEEGWELVAHTLDSRNWNTWWFKRPLS